ncbi:unnamed protein product, partial [marine sediment metagenome]
PGVRKERGKSWKMTEFVIKSGDLVRRSDGSLGVTVSVSGLEVEVLFGDGLREIVDVRELEVIAFKPGSEIPANFVEMVEAYKRGRGFG